MRAMTLSAVLSFLVKGGPVMAPLAVCSVLAAAVVLERAWFWWRARAAGDCDRILELAAAGKWDDAIEHARASREVAAPVLVDGLEQRASSPTIAMEGAARTTLVRLRRGLPVLDTIVTLSPLLGLLGTVTGMITAFGVMSASGMSQPHAITGGVAEALIATACGLGIAIVTLVPYNVLSARVEQAVGEIERQATRLELLLRTEAR
jgi:biopolymer transport protein ExbB